MIQYQLTQAGDGRQSLTFVDESGSFRSINSDNIGFRETLDAVLSGNLSEATANSTPLTTIVARLREADPAFGTDGDVVTRNGREVSSRLGTLLLTYARTGNKGVTALAKFIGRLAENPSRRSVESLYDWVEANGLTINSDGHIVGYKGVGNDGLSVHSGSAYVDGVLHTGRIPNPVGSTVTMPRNEVQDDPNVGCHRGLHVGSHSYASSFGARLLTVTVDPADVVSVPNDAAFAKMRVCKYVVQAINTQKASYAHTVVDNYDEDYDDYCDCPYCEGH